jgi:MFS family permease
VIVDRISRLRVMFWADVVRGIVTIAVAAAAVSGALEIWHVYIASIVFGFAAAFFQPAYVALVPEVTPKDHLNSANSLTSLSQQVATIAGPAIGALCIAIGGPGFGFALNGVSFVFAGLCVLGLPWNAIGRVSTVSRPGILGDLGEGFSAVFASPWLWVTIGLSAVANVVLAGPMSVALPYLLRQERHEAAAAYGLFLSFAAVGSVAVAVALGRRRRLRHRGMLAYGGLIGNGVMLILLGQALPIGGLWAAGLLGGACLTLFELIWINTIQENVPGHLLGRVFSVDQLGSFALVPLGYAGAGWATGRFGAPEVLVASGIALTALALAGLLHPAIRNLD